VGKTYGRPGGSLLARWQRRTASRPVGDVDEEDDEDDEELDDTPADGARRTALHDVSFRLAPGTTLGLIGGGGAGKTTLLKILARITPPTSGRVVVRGRVLPIIELASSFVDGSLTARNNVLLLAQLFGVPRREAKLHADEIVRLAELEDEGDALASTFSGGMLRRLAFATVLGLEPDVLLVDDVLTGDAAFRNRCLDAIERASAAGTTVLIASHDLATVRRLADSVLWLEEGRVVRHGGTQEVVDEFERASGRASRHPRSNAHVRIRSAFVETSEGAVVETLRAGESARLRIVLDVLADDVRVRCGMALGTPEGVHLRIVQAEAAALDRRTTYAAGVALPLHLLGDGTYSGRVGAFVEHDGVQTAVSDDDAFTLDVVDPRPDAEPAETPSLPHEIEDATWSFEPVEP
jgi:ABC-type polysaccharide/polyol phosphate transport system ATPase subunit